MSQAAPGPQVTPPARRRAEAEALYQLLKLVAADVKAAADNTLDLDAAVVVTKEVTLP